MNITPQEALDCFVSDDLIGIGMEADAVRRSLHPDDVVTYTVPCKVALDQPMEALHASIEAFAQSGRTSIDVSLPPDFTFRQVTEILDAVRRRFPAMRLNMLGTRNLLALSNASGFGLRQALECLQAAGLDSVAEETVDVDRSAQGSAFHQDRIAVHRLAHALGITSGAGLVIGLGESDEECVEHLFALRALQSETNALTAFRLFKPVEGTRLEPPTAVQYLRTLAIARIVLDNVPNLESSCMDQGLKVVQMALRFGANDAGSFGTPAASPNASFTEEDLCRVIRDAGFVPVERDSLYRTFYLNN